MAGRYRLIHLLRDMRVPERHIRATLQSELGLTRDEAEEALTQDRSAGASPPT